MRKHFGLGLALMLGATGTAFAADGISYKYVEGGYGYTDIKGLSGHADSFTVGGSAGFTDNIFGYGHVSRYDYSGFEATYLSAGVGYHTGISDTVDFLAGVSFEMADASGISSESGYGAKIGLRGRAGMNVELDGTVDYANFGSGEDGFEFTVGGRYHFTEAFSTGLSFSMDDGGDAKTVGLTLRYTFGG